MQREISVDTTFYGDIHLIDELTNFTYDEAKFHPSKRNEISFLNLPHKVMMKIFHDVGDAALQLSSVNRNFRELYLKFHLPLLNQSFPQLLDKYEEELSWIQFTEIKQQEGISESLRIFFNQRKLQKSLCQFLQNYDDGRTTESLLQDLRKKMYQELNKKFLFTSTWTLIAVHMMKHGLVQEENLPTQNNLEGILAFVEDENNQKIWNKITRLNFSSYLFQEPIPKIFKKRLTHCSVIQYSADFKHPLP